MPGGRLNYTLSPLEREAEQAGGGREQRLLGPGSALRALDHDPVPLEVDVTTGEQGDLPHPQAVVRSAEALDREEEGSQLNLGEVAGQALGL